MKNRKYIQFLIGVVFFVTLFSCDVNAAPPGRGDDTAPYAPCLSRRCDPTAGPVCAIDASGFPRTFENRCWAEFAYCREGRFYVLVKEGEC